MNIGDVIDGHTIEKSFDGGYYGFVYKVLHKATNKPLALKIPKDHGNPDDIVRFHIENDILHKLHPHDNIIKPESVVVELGTNQYYYTMELADTNLIVYISTNNNLSFFEKIKIFKEVCEGIEHAHCLSIAHRDLHFGNVLLKINDIPTVKLTDFGRAKNFQIENFITSNKPCWGYYVTPPEIIFNIWENNPKIENYMYGDIYALGIILMFIFGIKPDVEIAGLRRDIDIFIKNTEELDENEPHSLYKRWISNKIGSKSFSISLKNNDENEKINKLLEKLTHIDIDSRFKNVIEIKQAMLNLNI